MATPSRSSDEVARLGKALYERQIRRQVEHDHQGQVVVMDIDTGEFEIAPNHFTAATRARAKHPDATLFAVRIGYPALARIGGRTTVKPR